MSARAPRPGGRPHAGGRRGFALLLVLLVLVLVTAAAAEVHRIAQADRRQALNARAATRARWAARGGIARGLEQLHRAVAVSATARDVLASTGDTLLVPLAYVQGGEIVRVAITDARARVQINRVEPAELAALAQAVGIPRSTALRVADAIADWRDGDDLRRPNGAERADYARAGLTTGPANAPFASVEEVATVGGVTPEVYGRLAPHLSVAGDGRVNLNSAPAAVLRTVPFIDAAAAEAIVRHRARTPYRNVFDLASTIPEPARTAVRRGIGVVLGRVAFGPREVEVSARARAPGAPLGAELRAIVTLTGGAGVQLRGVAEW